MWQIFESTSADTSDELMIGEGHLGILGIPKQNCLIGFNSTQFTSQKLVYIFIIVS